MQMIAVIAFTFVGDAKLPAITHRFIAPTYKEARHIFRLHRKYDRMLRATTGQKDRGGESVNDFNGVKLRTVFQVRKVELDLSEIASMKSAVGSEPAE